MWDVTEVVIMCLNPMVFTCVLNQSKGYQLLSNALVIVINLIIAMKFQLDPFVDGSETYDQFDVEFQILNKNMWQKVMKVIRPILQFLRTFDSCQVHNMLALMVEPYYKSLWVVENYVGRGNVICLAI